ncbi:hypothetical protein [Pseudonocardia broussonetiae]|nr:hypothetical protein [Pseudonocardia broussonetiae]
MVPRAAVFAATARKPVHDQIVIDDHPSRTGAQAPAAAGCG